MSSTNRGGVREASDYYVTPAWAITDFLNTFTADAPALIGEDLTGRDLKIFDPCAGGNPKTDTLPERGMAYQQAIQAWGKWSLYIFDSMDIREDSPADIHADYLKEDLSGFHKIVPDIIITNPPFSLAMPIIEKSLKDVRQGGVVIMLQRLNFYGGQKEKRAFFDRVGLPIAAYVHRKRIPFMPPGSINPVSGKPFGQDSIEYAHFVGSLELKAKSPDISA